jgi:ribosomal protein L37AE/L43A
MSKKNQLEQKPHPCSFCGHTDWARSPSGKYLVCRNCGSIVLGPKRPPAPGQQAA